MKFCLCDILSVGGPLFSLRAISASICIIPATLIDVA